MRRGAVLPGLIVLAIGVVLVRLRRARADRVAAPVTGPATTVSLPPTAAGPTDDDTEAAPVAAPAPPRFLSVPWTLVAPPGGDTELEIAFARNAHEVLDRVDVQETPTQVFVTVIVRWRPHEPGPFAAETEETASVTLARPLGDRELVHGAIDVDERDGGPLYP